MIFEHEYKVKPKRYKKDTYPVAPLTPEKSQFYNKELSNSFGNRFSYEKYVKKDNKLNDDSNLDNNKKIFTEEMVNETDTHILIKKRNIFKK